MSLLKKMSFLLFASLLIVSCSSDSDDDTGGGTSVTISNLDFSVDASGAGNVVSVTPSADGATSYSVDFGTDAADDVLETLGAAVSYTYPPVAASYDITVTASAYCACLHFLFSGRAYAIFIMLSIQRTAYGFGLLKAKHDATKTRSHMKHESAWPTISVSQLVP